MFKSPEKKVQEYVARVNPAVMTSFRSDTPLGPSALVVGLSPECGVAARIIDGFWHTRMIRPLREGGSRIEGSDAPGYDRRYPTDVIAVSLIGTLVGLGLQSYAAVDANGEIHIRPGYAIDGPLVVRQMDQCLALIISMARGEIPHMRAIEISAPERAMQIFNAILDYAPSAYNRGLSAE